MAHQRLSDLGGAIFFDIFLGKISGRNLPPFGAFIFRRRLSLKENLVFPFGFL